MNCASSRLQRRKAVDALARRAVELGLEHGYTPPDGAAQEVGQTLQTALGDPEIGELVRAGRLSQAVTYGGFGPTDLASLSAIIRAQTVLSKEAQARRRTFESGCEFASPRLRRRRGGSRAGQSSAAGCRLGRGRGGGSHPTG